ncbi:hypothetical protein M8C22_06330 [Bacillus spizizenii]|uniref:hypothetical protein n=1 Tax=Bacillus spizizenii TaxID=96241 RepID=UPI0009A3453F|nr:hypothetical protein [Bacillus spizizenii]OPG90619.1 hypothetical protein B2I22_15290 [Bacillus spizizenii]
MKFEYSEELKGKISHLEELENQKKRTNEKLQEHDEKLAEELKKAEEALEVAVMELALDPSPAKRTKERKARETVESLRLEVSGGSERKRSVKQMHDRKIHAAKEDILRTLSAEVTEHKEKYEQSALDRVRKAKMEYLKAAAGYHDLIDLQCRQTYFDMARQIGETQLATQNGLFEKYRPRIYVNEPIFTYRPSGTNPYGIIEPEIHRAWTRGELPAE